MMMTAFVLGLAAVCVGLILMSTLSEEDRRRWIPRRVRDDRPNPDTSTSTSMGPPPDLDEELRSVLTDTWLVAEARWKVRRSRNDRTGRPQADDA